MNFSAWANERLVKKEPQIEMKTFVALVSQLRSLDPKLCSYCLDILEFFLEHRHSDIIFDSFDALNLDQILCHLLQNVPDDDVS
jgi:hypothetical protein